MGKLARAFAVALTILLLVPVVLARLPATWVAAVGGQPWMLRILLGLGVLWLMSWFRAVLYARLPNSPYLFGRTLTFTERGRRKRVAVDELEDVYVELRPPPVRQALMVERVDGRVHELCPAHWSGAGRLYASLSKQVRRARARRRRSSS